MLNIKQVSRWPAQPIPCDRASLVRLVKGSAFRSAVNRVPLAVWSLSEQDLVDKLRLSDTDSALKGAFWNEFRLMFAHSSQELELSRVYGGICTYTHFYNNILGHPEKLAWLLSPCVDLEIAARSLIMPALSRLRDLLEISIYQENGKVDPDAVKILLQTLYCILPLQARRNTGGGTSL